MKALHPIWQQKPETASRVRGRIELILDWAKTAGYREGENPARRRGHLQNLLAKPSAAAKAARKASGRGEHHAALPYAEIGAFMAALRQQPGVAARALEFTILTAARTGEVIRSSMGGDQPGRPGLDSSRRTDEGGQGASGAAVSGGDGDCRVHGGDPRR